MRMRWIVGAVGLAILAAGAVRAAVTGGQSGIVILVVVGGVLALSPFVIDRLESVSAGGTSVQVRFTQKVVEVGAPRVAKVLQQTGLGELADSYAFVHQELLGEEFGQARVYLQDLLVERSAAIAATQKLDPREVRKLLRDGSAIMRVLAIGMMTGDPSIADRRSITSAITDFQSKNEQYHALHLAKRCWPQLRKPDRQNIRDAVKNAIDSGAIPCEGDRMSLAEVILSLPVG
jgi:hypothetical protein